jgi:hypothetical protein
MAMCKRVTKQQPKMWGPSIVGYGSYTYRYESGHSGDACLAGFAVRGKELVVYLLAENPERVDLLAKLGRRWKVCLYFRRLADLDVKVLEALIAGSVPMSTPAPAPRRPNPRSTDPLRQAQHRNVEGCAICPCRSTAVADLNDGVAEVFDWYMNRGRRIPDPDVQVSGPSADTFAVSRRDSVPCSPPTHLRQSPRLAEITLGDRHSAHPIPARWRDPTRLSLRDRRHRAP